MGFLDVVWGVSRPTPLGGGDDETPSPRKKRLPG